MCIRDREDEEEPEPADGDAPSVAAIERTFAENLEVVRDANDWCTAAPLIEDGFDEIDNVNFSDPAALEAVYTGAFALLLEIQDLAPGEIEPDVARTVEGFEFLLGALSDAEWDFFNIEVSALATLSDDLELSAFNIEEYNFNECGIGEDPGEPPVLDSTVDEFSDDEFDGTLREQVEQSLVDAGFSEGEASCVLDNFDFADPESLSDPSGLLAVFDDCGIPLDRLGSLGG